MVIELKIPEFSVRVEGDNEKLLREAIGRLILHHPLCCYDVPYCEVCKTNHFGEHHAK